MIKNIRYIQKSLIRNKFWFSFASQESPLTELERDFLSPQVYNYNNYQGILRIITLKIN